MINIEVVYILANVLRNIIIMVKLSAYFIGGYLAF